MGDEEALVRGVSAAAIVAYLAFFVAAAYMGGRVLFYNYEDKFAQLGAADVTVQQGLYNDTVARQQGDILIEQEVAATYPILDADTAAREAEFELLLVLIQNETLARLAEEAPYAGDIAAEAAIRSAMNAIFDVNITTIEALVAAANAYDAYSLQQFMIKMQNITDMNTLLETDIAERIASTAALSTEAAQSAATIAYLTTAIAKEIHDRSIQDVLLIEWYEALVGTIAGNELETINGQSAVQYNINITSTNVRTIVTTTPGQVLLDNRAIRTIDSVTPAAVTLDIDLIPGLHVTVVNTAPHTFTVASTLVASQAPNFFRTVTSMVFPGTPTLSPSVWLTPSGCQWINPDGGTYLVDVTFTATIGTGSYAVWYLAAQASTVLGTCTTPNPLPGGCMNIEDSTLGHSDQTDVTLHTTLIGANDMGNNFYTFRYQPTINSVVLHAWSCVVQYSRVV
jgi:hypothetical protein